MGGLQNGAIQKGAQSSKGGEQSRSTTPAPNTPASSSTRNSQRAGKGSGTAGSLQDAPGSTSRQRKLLSHRVLGGSSPSIPGELVQGGASIYLEEMGLGSADEVSDIHGSLSLHEKADELGRDDGSRKQPGTEYMGQQVGSSSSLSPCGSLGWKACGTAPHVLLPVRLTSPSVVAFAVQWGQEHQTCVRLRLGPVLS